MVFKRRRTIAKEIVDQALNHFKKQQWPDSVGERSNVPEVLRRPEAAYEPSANFNKIFSGLIGEKSSADKNVRPEGTKTESSFEVNWPQNSSHYEPANYELHEQQQAEGTQSSQIENKRDEPPSASVSVFKKLSYEQKKEEEGIPSPQIQNKPNSQPTNSASIFKRLSHCAS